MPPKRHKIWDLCFDSGPKMPGKSYYPVSCKYCQSAWKHGKLEEAIKHIALVCENAPPSHRKMALEEYNASHSRARNTRQIITSGQISLDHQGELLPDDSVSQTSTSRRKRKPVVMVQEEKEHGPVELKTINSASVAKKSDNKLEPSSSSGLDQLYAAINVNNAPAYSIPRVDSASTGNRQVSSSIPTIPSLTNGMMTSTKNTNKTPGNGTNDVHSPISLDGQGLNAPQNYVADSDLFLASWLLKTNIPLECLECAEFRQFITSCSGGMYQLPSQHELQQIALVLLRQRQQQQQQQSQHGHLQMMHTNPQNTRHFTGPSIQPQQPQQQLQLQRQEQMLQSNPKRW